jgi:predicted metal-dependent hydrolase
MPPDMSKFFAPLTADCLGPVHPSAIEGMELFNRGQYFAAHEALEAAWREETGSIRELYRGILQVSVVYLHLSRGNFEGAMKVYQRSLRWLNPWPENCRGIEVGQLRRDLEAVIVAMQKLGAEHVAAFDRELIKPVIYVK